MTPVAGRLAGRVFLNARYLDPVLGRFISVDPMVEKTGYAYAYGNNSPVTFSDPSGLIIGIDDLIVIGIVVLVLAAAAETKANPDATRRVFESVGNALSGSHEQVHADPTAQSQVHGVWKTYADTRAKYATQAKAKTASAVQAGTTLKPDDPWLTFYHGTSTESGLALLSGAPLSLAAATENHIDGAIGFYLATDYDAAYYFGARRQGTMLTVTMRTSAYEALVASGSVMQPFPSGGVSPPGLEFFIPPTAFPTFDASKASGSIKIAPTPRSKAF
jgi:hypothetical protein